MPSNELGVCTVIGAALFSPATETCCFDIFFTLEDEFDRDELGEVLICKSIEAACFSSSGVQVGDTLGEVITLLDTIDIRREDIVDREMIGGASIGRTGPGRVREGRVWMLSGAADRKLPDGGGEGR